MGEIVEFHSFLNMKRSSNRISVRNKGIQSKLDNDIRSKSVNNLHSPYAGLFAVVKAT